MDFNFRLNEVRPTRGKSPPAHTETSEPAARTQHLARTGNFGVLRILEI